MSGINSITQAPGFDQQRYESFIRQARAEQADTGVVESLLLNAVRGGRSFDQALALVGSEQPKLPPPVRGNSAPLKEWAAIPSPGGLILSATTEFAAEQRRRNQELMWRETEAIAAAAKEQAHEMREAAAKQLALGLVVGVIQIGLGAAQAGMGAAALRNAAKAGEEAAAAAKAAAPAVKLGQAGEAAARQTSVAAAAAYNSAFSDYMTKANIFMGAVSQMGGGASGIVQAQAQYQGAEMQAKLKDIEADQEKMRAVRESVKNLDEGLRDLIHKALAAQNDILASTNQARTRILA